MVRVPIYLAFNSGNTSPLNSTKISRLQGPRELTYGLVATFIFPFLPLLVPSEPCITPQGGGNWEFESGFFIAALQL